jgi:hypothetical protein
VYSPTTFTYCNVGPFQFDFDEWSTPHTYYQRTYTHISMMVLVILFQPDGFHTQILKDIDTSSMKTRYGSFGVYYPMPLWFQSFVRRSTLLRTYVILRNSWSSLNQPIRFRRPGKHHLDITLPSDVEFVLEIFPQDTTWSNINLSVCSG